MCLGALLAVSTSNTDKQIFADVHQPGLPALLSSSIGSKTYSLIAIRFNSRLHPGLHNLWLVCGPISPIVLRAFLHWQPDLPAGLATVLTAPAVVAVEAKGPLAGLGAVEGAGAGAMPGPSELASPAATFRESGNSWKQQTDAHVVLTVWCDIM